MDMLTLSPFKYILQWYSRCPLVRDVKLVILGLYTGLEHTCCHHTHYSARYRAYGHVYHDYWNCDHCRPHAFNKRCVAFYKVYDKCVWCRDTYKDPPPPRRRTYDTDMCEHHKTCERHQCDYGACPNIIGSCDHDTKDAQWRYTFRGLYPNYYLRPNTTLCLNIEHHGQRIMAVVYAEHYYICAPGVDILNLFSWPSKISQLHTRRGPTRVYNPSVNFCKIVTLRHNEYENTVGELERMLNHGEWYSAYVHDRPYQTVLEVIRTILCEI
jgi:hypothetical protein